MNNKKTFTFLLLLAILMLFFGFILGSAYEQEKVKEGGQYPKMMVVYELDEEKNMIRLRDFNGFKYQIKGIEDTFEGDVFSCIMDDAGTDTITDDTIIDYRYSGWLEGWNE